MKRNPVVICSRSSGSVFPFLATTVSCTAADAGGNRVHGTFDVIVKDAPQQLADTGRTDRETMKITGNKTGGCSSRHHQRKGFG